MLTLALGLPPHMVYVVIFLMILTLLGSISAACWCWQQLPRDKGRRQPAFD
jgi:hypothetical protein